MKETTTTTHNERTERRSVSFSLDPFTFAIAQIFTFGGLIV